jgi:hypothetical protein
MAMIAQPGDDDLTFDVDGLSLDNIVICGRDMIIKLSNGFGWWINPDGEVATFTPGAEDSRVTDVEFTFDFSDWEEPYFDHLVNKLETWRRDQVMVRMLCAPERICTLVHDKNDWLPLAKTRG